MIYPELKIHPHFLKRFTQRLKIRLHDVSSINGVIRRIQTESWHMNDVGDREVLLFRIKKRFYVGIVSRPQQLLLTIYHPNFEKRELAFYTFENADHARTTPKTMKRYDTWRRNLLQGNGWHVGNLPYDNQFMQVVLWGNYKTSAFFDGERWVDDFGTCISPLDVWGWRNE